MNILKLISKFSVPFIFTVMGIILLFNGTQSKVVENVVCYQAEFDEATASLMTEKDLDYGDFPELVAQDNKLADIIAKRFDQNKLITDSLMVTKKAYSTREIDSAYGLHLIDSLQLVDSINKVQTNTYISEKNEVRSKIQKELDFQNSLIKENAVIKPQVSFSQNSQYTYGGLGLLVCAVLMFLFIGNVINRKLTMILVPVFAITAVIMIYLTNKSISKLDKYNSARENAYTETKQRFLDIRAALLQYKEDNQKYPESLEDLVEYIKTGDTYFVLADGDVPANRFFTAEEAFLYFHHGKKDYPIDGDSTEFKAEVKAWSDTTLITYGDLKFDVSSSLFFDIISRDTVRTPVKEKLFTGPTAQKRNSEMAFSEDSLTKMAYFDIPFVYRTAKILDVEASNDSIKKYKHRFEVRLKSPMFKYNNDNECEQRIDLRLGSLHEDKTTGNWN